MKYKIKDEAWIEIMPDVHEPIEEILLEIARCSYESADVRDKQWKYQHAVAGTPKDFSEYIKTNSMGTRQLIMDYINGRDCRTNVSRFSDGTWNLHYYSFEQRGVTADQFFSGERAILATEFLDVVAERIKKKYAHEDKKLKLRVIKGEKD